MNKIKMTVGDLLTHIDEGSLDLYYELYKKDKRGNYILYTKCKPAEAESKYSDLMLDDFAVFIGVPDTVVNVCLI